MLYKLYKAKQLDFFHIPCKNIPFVFCKYQLPSVRIELTTPYRRPDLKSGALTTRPTWRTREIKNK